MNLIYVVRTVIFTCDLHFFFDKQLTFNIVYNQQHNIETRGKKMVSYSCSNSHGSLVYWYVGTSRRYESTISLPVVSLPCLVWF